MATSIQAAGQGALPFLLVTPGARPSAMGESFVAVAEGAETVAVNPAGLSQSRQGELSFQHISYVQGILNDNVFYSRPAGKGSWAVQVGYDGVNGLDQTVSNPASADGYTQTGSFSAYDLQAAFSFGRTITDSFSLGGTARLVRESLSDASANGAGFDLGLLYNDSELPVRLGLSIQHVGTSMKFKDESFNLPGLARAGIALTNPKDRVSSWLPEKTILSAEILRMFDGGDLTARAGAELPLYEENLFVRAGYSYPFRSQTLGSSLSLPRGLSLGTGFKFNFWKLDYAMNSLGKLGLAHRISLTFFFGSKS